ncbi:hypothetical protein [Nocardia grenadensis]
MSAWVSDAQFRCIESGLRILSAYTRAEGDVESALAQAVESERDLGRAAVGLATVSRLLAIELAAASGRSERAVVDDLESMVRMLQSAEPRHKSS